MRFPEHDPFDVSPDGSTLAGSTFEDGPILALVDTSSGAFRRRPLPEGADFAGFGSTTAFEPDDSSVVTLECRPCEEGRVVPVRRDPTDGTERAVTELPMVDFFADRIEFSGNGEVLAVIGTIDRGGRAVFLDADSLDVRYRLRRDDLHSTALSDDGRTLAVGGEDGTVTLIDLPTGTEDTFAPVMTASCRAWRSPRTSTLVTSGDDLAVNVWISRRVRSGRRCTATRAA